MPRQPPLTCSEAQPWPISSLANSTLPRGLGTLLSQHVPLSRQDHRGQGWMEARGAAELRRPLILAQCSPCLPPSPRTTETTRGGTHHAPKGNQEFTHSFIHTCTDPQIFTGPLLHTRLCVSTGAIRVRKTDIVTVPGSRPFGNSVKQGPPLGIPW